MRKKIQSICVTGGAGFIGSEFVRQGISLGYKMIVVDKITYAGDMQRLKKNEGKYAFYNVDITHFKKMETVLLKEKPQAIVHCAAETHVDRSIQDPTPFISTNINGTQNLIDLAVKHRLQKFLHVSTDEVYGESRKGRFKETAPMLPGNPYSATKASAEFLVRAAMRTHDLNAIIIRPVNNYGPWQYPEKFIPVIILKALKNKKIPVYGKGKQIREWLHVSDCAKAIHLILKNGKIGSTYNIGSYFDRPNIVTAKTILRHLGKSEKLIQFVKDRPGHDFRYSVDCSLLRTLGWKPQIGFNKGIKETIQWYNEHRKWLENKRKFLESYRKKAYTT